MKNELLSIIRKKDLSHKIEKYADSLYLIEEYEEVSFYDMAKALSDVLPGQFWPGRDGLCWQNGSKSIWIAPAEEIESIEAARSILGAFVGWVRPLPYSVPSIGRRLIKTLGFSQPGNPTALDFLIDYIGPYYYRAYPGKYSYCYQWDIKRCYHRLAELLPSPIVSLSGNELIFTPLRPEQLSRWRDVIAATKQLKGLRNSLLGSLLGSSGASFYSYDPRKKEGVASNSKPRYGLFRPAAMAIKRAAYLACYLGAEESNAVYANTDCVITKQAQSPKIWQKLGLQSDLQAYGKTEIKAIGLYKVGSEKTELFDTSKFSHKFEDKPVTEDFTQWLM